MTDGSISLCRLCRKTCDFSINIFDPNGTKGLLVWKIIKELLQLDVCKEDGLPVTICHECMDKVSEFKYFKAMCITSRIEFLKASVNRGLVDSEPSPFLDFPHLKFFPRDSDSSKDTNKSSFDSRLNDCLEDRKPSVELLNRNIELSRKQVQSPSTSASTDIFMPIVTTVIGSTTIRDVQHKQSQMSQAHKLVVSSSTKLDASLRETSQQKRRSELPEKHSAKKFKSGANVNSGNVVEVIAKARGKSSSKQFSSQHSNKEVKTKTKVQGESMSADSGSTNPPKPSGTIPARAGVPPNPNNSAKVSKKRPSQNLDRISLHKSESVPESRIDTTSGGGGTAVSRETQEGVRKCLKNPSREPSSNRSLTETSVDFDKRNSFRRDSLNVSSKVIVPSSELRGSSIPKGDDSRAAKVPSLAKKPVAEANKCLGGCSFDLGNDSSSESDGEHSDELAMPSESSSEEEMVVDGSFSVGVYACPVIGCRKKFDRLKGLLIHSKRVKHPNDEFMKHLQSNSRLREELKKCRSLRKKKTVEDLPSDGGGIGKDLNTLVVADEVGFAVSGSKDDSPNGQNTGISTETHIENIWRCNIDGCELEYGSKRSLSIHRAYKHNPGFVNRRKGIGKQLPAAKVSKDKEQIRTKVRRCHYCLKEFKSLGGLRRHLEKNHRLENDNSDSDTNEKPSEGRKESLKEETRVKNMGSPSNGVEKPKIMPKIRECYVVLHDIMKCKNPPSIPLRNTTSEIVVAPRETLNVSKKSGEGILKYFPVVSTLNTIPISFGDVTKIGKKSSPCDKLTLGKASRLGLPSGNHEKESSFKAAGQEKQVPVSTLFANAVKCGTSQVSEEVVPEKSSKITSPTVSNQSNAVVFKELAVSLHKLPLSPDKMSTNVVKSPEKKPVSKSSSSERDDSLKEHGVSEPFLELKCNVCMMVFSSKPNLHWHIKLQHGWKPAHVCAVCNKSYISRAKLMLHLKQHDPNLQTSPGKKSDLNGDVSFELGQVKPGVIPNRTSHSDGDQQNNSLEHSLLLESEFCPGSPNRKVPGDRENKSSHEQDPSGNGTDISEESRLPKITNKTEISKAPKVMFLNSATLSKSTSTSSAISITGDEESSNQSPVDIVRNVIISGSVSQLQTVPDDSETVNNQLVLVNDKSKATVPKTGVVTSSSASTKLKYKISGHPTAQSDDESASFQCSSVIKKAVDALVPRTDSSITSQGSDKGNSEHILTKPNIDPLVSPRSYCTTERAVPPRKSEACISAQEVIKGVPAIKEAIGNDLASSCTPKLVQEVEIKTANGSNSVVASKMVCLGPNVSGLTSAGEMKVLETRDTSQSVDGIPETGGDIIRHSTGTDVSTTAPDRGYVKHPPEGHSKNEVSKTNLLNLNFRPVSEESDFDVRCGRVGKSLEVQKTGKSKTGVEEAGLSIPAAHSGEVPSGILEKDSSVGMMLVCPRNLLR